MQAFEAIYALVCHADLRPIKGTHSINKLFIIGFLLHWEGHPQVIHWASQEVTQGHHTHHQRYVFLILLLSEHHTCSCII